MHRLALALALALIPTVALGASGGGAATLGAPRVELHRAPSPPGASVLVPMNEQFRVAVWSASTGAFLGEEAPVHDQAGARIKDGKFKLFFDAFERLVRVEDAQSGATVGRYRYDAGGRRVHRVYRDPTSGATKEEFYVSDGAREVEEVDGAGSVLASYVWGEQYVDQVLQMRRGGQDYYLHANSVYSVAAVTDSGGAVVERVDYRSIYGVHEVTDGAGVAKAAGVEVGNPWRFQGRRYDPETGWFYFRQRYLDPEKGRFVSRDPLGLWGDPGNLGNPYAYAGNDPVNRVDPWGLDGDRVIQGNPLELGALDYFAVGWDAVFGTGYSVSSDRPRTLGDAAAGVQQAVVEDVLAPAGQALGQGWSLQLENIKSYGPFGPAVTTFQMAGQAVAGLPVALSEALTKPSEHVVDAMQAAAVGDGQGVFRHLTGALVGFVEQGLAVYGGVRTARGLKQVARPAPCQAGMTTLERFLDALGICFLAGTLVETPEGKEPIEDIEVGDWVLSRDERTGEVGYKRVTRLSRGKAVQVCRVTIAPAGDGSEPCSTEAVGQQEILSTRDHPYYSVSRQGWVDADLLRVGELLRGSDGSLVRVVAVTWWVEEARTYNFEVEDWHSYFVSAVPNGTAVWVHNGPLDLVPDASSGGATYNRGGSSFTRTGVPTDLQLPQGHGVVYMRTGPNGTYVGQANDITDFRKRMYRHDTTLGTTHTYRVLGTAPQGEALSALEESWIRAGGGPQRHGGPLENDRWQMNEQRYRAAGGQVDRSCH